MVNRIIKCSIMADINIAQEVMLRLFNRINGLPEKVSCNKVFILIEIIVIKRGMKCMAKQMISNDWEKQLLTQHTETLITSYFNKPVTSKTDILHRTSNYSTNDSADENVS